MTDHILSHNQFSSSVAWNRSDLQASPRRRAALVASSACAAVALALSPVQTLAGCNSGNNGQSDTLSSSACQASAVPGGALAIGNAATRASGIDSTALGLDAEALGAFATAIGFAANAAGADSIAIGGAHAGTGSLAIGTSAGSFGPTDIQGHISIGHFSGDRGTGAYSIAIGRGFSSGNTIGTSATGAYSIAIGSSDDPALPGALAEGSRSVAIGQNSHAGTGGGFGTAVGFNTLTAFAGVAIGTDAKASGDSGTAVGRFSAAVGDFASAYGEGSGAGGNNSAAYGHSSVASAESAVALGFGAKATRKDSVALGRDSIANVPNAVSVGHRNHERRIINVANAVDNTDAATLGQVKALIRRATLAPAAMEATPVPGVVIASRTSTEAFTAHRGPDRQRERAVAPATGRGTGDRREDLEQSDVVGWAKVRADGSIAGARNIIDNVRRNIGEYEIAFKHASLAECVYTATLHGAGLVSVNEGSSPNSLTIETRNHSGVLTDLSFHLMVTC